MILITEDPFNPDTFFNVEFDPDTVQFRTRWRADGNWSRWYDWDAPNDNKYLPADYLEWLPDL